jgi:hypothetical protein
MIAIGGKPWQPKQGPTRIYLNDWAPLAGLQVDRYKSGNIKWATLDGEKISNARAARLLQGKVYFVEDSLVLEVDPSLREAILASIEARIKAL